MITKANAAQQPLRLDPKLLRLKPKAAQAIQAGTQTVAALIGRARRSA